MKHKLVITLIPLLIAAGHCDFPGKFYVEGDSSSICGNGAVDPGETCDPPETCPVECNDGNPCTSDLMTGSPSDCDAACSFTPISSCAGGDGCCPAGCNPTSDTDCSLTCGDGQIDPGETCDPPETCPAECNDGDSCTSDEMTGSAANCNAACSFTPISSCAGGDGCCPAGCDAAADPDCSRNCGNGVVDPGETCDPPSSCPSSCNDGDLCTADEMTGSASNCNAACSFTPVSSCAGGDLCCPAGCNAGTDSDCAPSCGNSVIEPGETCDPPSSCPSSCDDGNSCTTDSMSGSASTCNVSCSHGSITACTGGDRCCPPGCNPTSDSDCVFDCRNDASWPSSWASFEQDVVTQMNSRRSSGAVCNGVSMTPVGPLTMDADLREAARCHSLDMAENGFFDHTGSDGSSPWDRIAAAGYTGFPIGENIAGGQSTPAGAVSAWMSSTAGHCEMIMSSSANEVGIGYAYEAASPWGHYWTADFGWR